MRYHKVTNNRSDMDFSDKIAIYSLIGTMVSIFVAMYYARKSNRYQKKVDLHQGVFKKGDLKLSLFGLDDSVSGGFLDYLILAGPIKKKPVTLMPVPIRIENVGSATVNEVEILISAHRSLRVIGSDALRHEAINTSKDIKLSYSDTGYRQNSTLSIDHVNPKLIINYEDAFMLNSAFPLSFKVEAKTKDDYLVTIPIHTLITTDYSMAVYMRDEEPLQRSLKVIVIDTSEETLLEQLNKYNNAAEKSYSPPHFLKRLFQPRVPLEQFTLIEFNESGYCESEGDFSKVDLDNVTMSKGFMLKSGRIITAHSAVK